MISRGLISVAATAVLISGCSVGQQIVTNKEVQEKVSEKVVAAPETFNYTENPTLAMIPDKPAQGEFNGQAFEVKTVIFQPGYDGKWELLLMKKKMEDPTDVMREGQYFNLGLNAKPGSGVVMTHKMEFGGGLCQIKKIDNPEETTSWNSDNAWVLEITQWDVKPWDPEGDIFQVAGTASGRVAVCYKGTCGFADSWVAGTFSGAIVRYMGEPDWVQSGE